MLSQGIQKSHGYHCRRSPDANRVASRFCNIVCLHHRQLQRNHYKTKFNQDLQHKLFVEGQQLVQ